MVRTPQRALATKRLWACLAMATACAASPSAPKGPPRAPLVIGPTTSSSFEGERLPIGGLGRFVCAGLLDLDGTGTLAPVLVESGGIRVFRREGAAWKVSRTALSVVTDNSGEEALGCAAADFDGDGRVDVLVTSATRGVIAWNTGTDFVTTDLPALPLDVSYGVAFAATPIDADGDGLPDIYVGREGSLPTALATQRVGAICSEDPDERFECADLGMSPLTTSNVLLVHDGPRSFVTVQSGAEGAQWAQAAAALDLDGDGVQELFSCNHFGKNSTFRRVSPAHYAAADLGLSENNDCMGVSWGDFDGDGRLDAILSEIGSPALYLGADGGLARPATSHGFEPVAQWAWGVEMEDLDNDGDLDVIFENQLVTFEDWKAICATCSIDDGPQHETLLYRNDGHGNASAEDPAVFPDDGTAPKGGTVLVTGDVDGDGVLDALVLRGTKGPEPHHNVGQLWLLHGRVKTPGGWLEVDAPLGAVVEVCVGDACRRREMIGGGSFMALRPNRLHFGLGPATAASVTVRFADGRTKAFGTVPSGTRVVAK